MPLQENFQFKSNAVGMVFEKRQLHKEHLTSYPQVICYNSGISFAKMYTMAFEFMSKSGE